MPDIKNKLHVQQAECSNGLLASNSFFISGQTEIKNKGMQSYNHIIANALILATYGSLCCSFFLTARVLSKKVQI